MPKLLRTLRLDPSDTFVFERAAEPGEWAVTGSVLFWEGDLEAMTPKARAAFRSGFLGLATLGYSTLVEVAEVSEEERDAVTAEFAEKLLTTFGAPSREVAMRAAADEIGFAASLCDHAPGTVIAMHRAVEKGEIKEQFRTLRPRDPATRGADRLHAFARAFEVIEVDEPQEQVDLLGLRDKL
jgi:hypothetical protein